MTWEEYKEKNFVEENPLGFNEWAFQQYDYNKDGVLKGTEKTHYNKALNTKNYNNTYSIWKDYQASIVNENAIRLQATMDAWRIAEGLAGNDRAYELAKSTDKSIKTQGQLIEGAKSSKMLLIGAVVLIGVLIFKNRK